MESVCIHPVWWNCLFIYLYILPSEWFARIKYEMWKSAVQHIYLDHVLHWLLDAAAASTYPIPPNPNWQTLFMYKSPVQSNSIDCGIYAILSCYAMIFHYGLSSKPSSATPSASSSSSSPPPAPIYSISLPITQEINTVRANLLHMTHPRHSF